MSVFCSNVVNSSNHDLELGVDFVDFSVDNFKARVMVAVLWLDDSSHASALVKLDDLKFNYVFVIHDKDEGVKPHVHLFLRFCNARYRSSVAKDLGISDNYLHKVINSVAYIRYMIHFGNKFRNKYQYSVDDYVGPLSSWAVECVNNLKLSTADFVNLVCHFIDSSEYVSLSSFWSYCYSMNFGKVVFNHFYFFKHYLDEHNSRFIKK